MKIAALQMDITWEDRPTNYDKARRFARQAADRGAELLVLPEMFATGFSMNPAVTAEPEDGPTERFIKELAAEHRLAVLGGLVTRAADGRGKNIALAVDTNGQPVDNYVKTHLFSFLEEDRHHSPGERPTTFTIKETTCASLICYDLRFPELFRLVTDEAEVIFVIASWPSTRQQHWDILLRARAVENQLYIVGVNRVGQGGGLTFTGGSALIDPMGNVLAHGGDQEELLIAEVDSKNVKKIRAELPFLKDRRF